MMIMLVGFLIVSCRRNVPFQEVLLDPVSTSSDSCTSRFWLVDRILSLYLYVLYPLHAISSQIRYCNELNKDVESVYSIYDVLIC